MAEVGVVVMVSSVGVAEDVAGIEVMENSGDVAAVVLEAGAMGSTEEGAMASIVDVVDAVVVREVLAASVRHTIMREEVILTLH